MNTELKKAWADLKSLLDMIPISQDNSIQLRAINDGELACKGMLRNNCLCMDHLTIGANVETIWTIHDIDIHFMILSGSVDLNFRLNTNIHTKHLSSKQSLRIPAGIPFMLKTFERPGALLLISIKGGTNGE